MANKYEYEVWMIQNDRVTFVNGRWRGPGNMAKMRPDELARAIQSCPLIWDLLNERGREGWELTNILNIESDGAIGSKAFLKRAF